MSKNEDKKVVFRSLLNPAKTISSPSGKKIYEWTYLGPDGKVEKGKKDVYEEIQSFKRQTDVKSKIERGEDINDGSGLYLDVSQFDGSYSDLNERLSSLADLVRKEISALKTEAAGTPRAEAPQASSPVPTDTGKKEVGGENNE